VGAIGIEEEKEEEEKEEEENEFLSNLSHLRYQNVSSFRHYIFKIK
jgi:hypothetical protein